jgi:hypothetical protein
MFDGFGVNFGIKAENKPYGKRQKKKAGKPGRYIRQSNFVEILNNKNRRYI